MGSPFHDGERRVQESAGELEIADRNGVAISDRIVAGAMRFIEQQPLVVVASEKGDDVWASVLLAEPGFARAVTDRRIEIDLYGAMNSTGDPLARNLENGGRVGLLFIDLSTRRRLRVNGHAARTGKEVAIDVSEAYPNCPKYIQRRHLTIGSHRDVGDTTLYREGSSLDEELVEMIRRADTFFVASRHFERGLDASHRGGRSGFVNVIDASTLRIPDYPGNSMFNTLGNFQLDPRAGVLFWDFPSGRTLQLSGQASIRLDLDRPIEETAGTGRYWDLAIERWIAGTIPGSPGVEVLDSSPFNPEIRS